MDYIPSFDHTDAIALLDEELIPSLVNDLEPSSGVYGLFRALRPLDSLETVMLADQERIFRELDLYDHMMRAFHLDGEDPLEAAYLAGYFQANPVPYVNEDLVSALRNSEDGNIHAQVKHSIPYNEERHAQLRASYKPKLHKELAERLEGYRVEYLDYKDDGSNPYKQMLDWAKGNRDDKDVIQYFCVCRLYPVDGSQDLHLVLGNVWTRPVSKVEPSHHMAMYWWDHEAHFYCTSPEGQWSDKVPANIVASRKLARSYFVNPFTCTDEDIRQRDSHVSL